MKRLSAPQLRVIVALNFAIICLLAGLFIWFYPREQPASGGAPPDVYSRVRAAQISLNPFLSWELKLEGYGPDEAVFSHIDDETGCLYVFGNTKSADRDFDRPGIFLIIVDIYGVTKENGFFAYGEETDVLKAVTLYDGGFALAIEGATPYLLGIGLGGEILKKTDGFIQSFESVTLLRLYSDGYLLFTQPEYKLLNLKRLRCVFLDRSLNFKGSCLAVSDYSLEPTDLAVISGKPVVFCSAVSTLHSLPAAVEFFLSGSPRITIFDKYPGSLAGFSVGGGDFLLLTAYNGSSLLHVSIDLQVKGVTHLGQLRPLFLKELDSENFAVFLESSTMILNSNYTTVLTLPSVLNPCDIKYINRSALVACIAAPSAAPAGSQTEIPDNYDLSVNIFVAGKPVYSAAVGSGYKVILAVNANQLFCVYHCDGNVIIAALRYPMFL